VLFAVAELLVDKAMGLILRSTELISTYIYIKSTVVNTETIKGDTVQSYFIGVLNIRLTEARLQAFICSSSSRMSHSHVTFLTRQCKMRVMYSSEFLHCIYAPTPYVMQNSVLSQLYLFFINNKTTTSLSIARLCIVNNLE